MLITAGKRLAGPYGEAVECVLPPVGQRGTISQDACVSLWLLFCPGQTPAWSNYYLAIVHLRDVGGNSGAAYIRHPGMTHEILLAGLDISGELDLNKRTTVDDFPRWRFLTPFNVSEQVELPNDDSARELLEMCAVAMLDGDLWAEPPLSGQKEPWRTTLIKTAAHARGETHTD